MPDAGFRMLPSLIWGGVGGGERMLDAGYWILDTGYWMSVSGIKA
jgi:hypothetical protein